MNSPLKPKKKETRTLDNWLVTKETETIDEDSRTSKLEEADKRKEENETKTLGHLSKTVEEFLRNVNLVPIKDRNIYYDFNLTIVKKLFPKKILVVTEKPKVASALVKAISSNFKPKLVKYGSNGDVALKWLTYYNGIEIVIVPLSGHITTHTTKTEFSGDWSRSDPLDLIRDETAIVEKVTRKNIEKILKEESKNADVFIIATDADEEGANIGFEAYKIVKNVKGDIPTYQLWFLSVDKNELRKAFLKPIEPKWSWAYSVQARRIIDAIVGFSATRELTLVLKEHISKLGLNVASIGRVQTPTLYLIYLREKEIREFQPKPYWAITAITSLDSQKYEFRHIDSPIYDKEKAYNIYEKIKNEKEGRIVSIEKEKTKKLAPKPLNTTRALTDINRLFGIPSNKSMRVLEDLYLNGLITYPRTDTDKYPTSFDHAKNLEKLSTHPELAGIIKDIIKKGAKIIRNGQNLVGDHLPITPIDVPHGNDKRLKTLEHKKIYDFILRRYLALFLPPALIERRKIYLNIKDVLFTASDVHVLDKGYFIVYPFDEPKEVSIPINLVGQILDIDKILIKEDKTKPPPPLSEHEVIKLMERLGLGTKSTRPDHIETLIKRHYVERKGRKLRITPLGWSLMEHLEDIWPDFVKPYFSANIQNLMRLVMNNEMGMDEMVNRSRKEFLELFMKLRKSLPEKLHTIAKAIERSVQDRSPIECPKCGAPMIEKAVSKKAVLLKCTNCGFSVVLPKYKKISVLKDVKCKICGHHPYVIQRKRKLYLCLVCFKEIGFCFNCPRKEECEIGKYLRKEEEKYQVGLCEDCNSVAIYVPEKRIVICKDCKNKVYYLPKKGTLRLLTKKHDECGWRLFSVTQKGERKYFCAKCGKFV
ncbi:MAG: DNA topoisomerase [Candidatus Njordarchaeia archaeon]